MQNNHHLDNDFDKINSLYLNYLEALKCPNNENLIFQIKEKIVVTFWKTLQKTASITQNMIEHTDVLVQKIYYCIDKCVDFNDPFCFSKYTYKSIKNALGAKADAEEFEINSGMHITDPENRKRKRIEKAYKQFNSFNSKDINEFIEYAVNHLGFSKEDVEVYLFPKQAVSLFVQSKTDSNDEYCIIDTYIDSLKNENNVEMISSIDQLQEQLKTIDTLWLKQKNDARPILSELLTRELLDDFKKNTVSNAVIDILKQSNFICKPMIETFFDDITSQIPTLQEIGQKYGITKSAASVKLTRFIEKLKETVKV